MDLASITNSSQGGVTTTPTDKSTLGKDDFLKLLMAQMSNQDPSNPTDSSTFVAQLAQFANVEQLQTVNSSLQTLLVAQSTNNQTQATSLIGKDVSFKSSNVTFDGTNATAVHGNLSANAATVTATITDSSGKVVRTLNMGSASAGELSLPWDGKDLNGAPLPAGSYSVKVVAADTSGKAIPVTTEGSGHVTGVSYANGYPQLQVGSTTLSMSDIVTVSESTTASN